ncbi:DUF2303 family protein [Acinetobacter tianfuensis]|uniref:DUF2303 family protein n=1 Tax=Acinetobacter tianfuensis TaxID=2419603 RepID=A0A3A8ED78_9GAMM|nr:DUF2303 family protein [Acinetobacter tianfuensis]RKG31466.1 DUF2303 family protein [Acinetobacter tianfuensis]
MNNEINQNNDLDAYRAGQLSQQYANANLPFVVVPGEGKVHTFPETLDRPLQLQQTVSLHTAKDFIGYVNRFADKNSVIFVNVLGGKIQAVLDYHEASPVEEYGSNAKQRHCLHKAIFNVEQTPEFKKIRDKSGESMSQSDFALFLEDVMPYINQPAAAELYEIVSTLSAKTSVDFKSGIRTDNGQVSITYNENIDANAGREGKLNIPEQIVFGIQVHRGGSHYALPARFRYRIKDGNLRMYYDLDQLEKAIEKSMEDTVTYIREGKVIDNGDGTETNLSGVHSDVTILEGSVN